MKKIEHNLRQIINLKVSQKTLIISFVSFFIISFTHHNCYFNATRAWCAYIKMYNIHTNIQHVTAHCTSRKWEIRKKNCKQYYVQHWGRKESFFSATITIVHIPHLVHVEMKNESKLLYFFLIHKLIYLLNTMMKQ